MTDKPDARQGEQKPFYSSQQRAVLARKFGESALPLLEDAARVISNLASNPIGKVQSCYPCGAVRVRVLGDNQPQWRYMWPEGGEPADPEHCERKDGSHEWRTKENRSGY